jgi:hypothetical protein
MLVALSLTAFASGTALEAQSVTSGTVTGTVRDGSFRPVPRAFVSVSPTGVGTTYEATTTGAGTFSINLVQPGSYEIRVEAVGYRPLVARVLTVGGGESRNVSLTLTAEPPPVTRVDTVALGPASSSKVRSGALQLGGTEVEGLPYRFEDIGSMVGLSTSFDDALGAQGLPGEMTLIVADGVPFYRAVLPAARRELLSAPLFPRSSLSGVTAIHDAGDIEWSGAGGGYVGLSTRGGSARRRIELEGSWSGTPTWSSGQLEGEAPSILSWQGAARGAVQLSPRLRFFASGEALQQQTPVAARVTPGVQAALSGLDDGILSALAEPSLEDYDRYSGLVRFDLQQSSSTRLFARVAAGVARRSFEGPGPADLTELAAPAEESVDFSAALGLVSQYSRASSFELRAGFSGSSREFDPTFEDVSPAYVVRSATPLGSTPGSNGSVSRTDFVAMPTFRWSPGSDGSGLKFGATIRASRHAMTYSPAPFGEFAFPEPAAVVGGRGFGIVTSAPEATFGTQEYGLFVQGESGLASGLRLRVGARYDYEIIGADGPTPNPDWLAATGLDNTVFPDRHHQFGLRASLSWDPYRDGSTRVHVLASTHTGDVDVRALSEAVAGGTDVTSARYAGSGITWPDGGIPPQSLATLPSLTLLGPDLRPPRTTRADLDIVQRVSPGTSVFVRASARRTDFLIRRRNLNLPVVPSALDPYGRAVFGSLDQDGSLVTTTADDARRFPSFGSVYALDPDGWSEYVGVTGGVEHVTSNLELFAAYTYSRTEDNWIGAGGSSIDASLPPNLPRTGDEEVWGQRTSDFDVPHRIAAGATIRQGRVSVSGVYRFRSGLPFTPRYRAWVDANGDGSGRNDIAFVPSVAQLGTLASEWPCLEKQAGGFAWRNSCRGPAAHAVDLRVQVALGRLGGMDAVLSVDGLNLIEGAHGVIDDALMLVDRDAAIDVSSDGSTVTIPTVVNDGFGSVLYPASRGRMIRVGVRLGG